mgnify:CR=1 FL=1
MGTAWRAGHAVDDFDVVDDEAAAGDGGGPGRAWALLGAAGGLVFGGEVVVGGVDGVAVFVAGEFDVVVGEGPEVYENGECG